MSGTSEEAELQPIVRPHVVRFLKDRPRLVDKGVRQEFLEELEKQMVMRRRPDTAAERAVDAVFDRFRDAGRGVARERVRQRLSEANETVLQNI